MRMGVPCKLQILSAEPCAVDFVKGGGMGGGGDFFLFLCSVHDYAQHAHSL